MVKKKDYMLTIIIGSLWSFVCLALALGGGALIKFGTDNDIAMYGFGIIVFILGIYMGREFFKVEMRTVKKNDPSVDWMSVLKDMQLLILAGLYVTSINQLNDGFNWLGLGSLVCGLLLTIVFVIFINMRFEK